MNQPSRFQTLRKKHPVLIYHSYTLGNGEISYHFSMDEWHFRPQWTFSPDLLSRVTERALLEELVFHLGMAELVSYWKAACPPVIDVRCHSLTPWQVDWWKKLYWNGLGEFFYRNQIDCPEDWVTIIAADTEKPPCLPLPCEPLSGCLIPVGGGKDSVVTMELLREKLDENLCFIINPREATLGTARLAGFTEQQTIAVQRTIDPTLLELNRQGYLNGHTPFSAIVAFSSLFFAVLCGKQYIVLSNESSANEGNVSGSAVNHQYSKSSAFERDFQLYVQDICGAFPFYFSLLRPWSEWQIMRTFSQHPEYLPVFQSCNLGSKTDIWCCNCPKCVYMYIMLAAFFDDTVLLDVFGTALLDDMRFSSTVAGLIEEDSEKPFECVGTKEEVRHALKMAYLRRDKATMPKLLSAFYPAVQNDTADLDNAFYPGHLVPDAFLPYLRQ